MQIIKVKSIELLDIIQFLGIGFKMSRKQQEKSINYLISSNKDIDFYGYAAKYNDSIVGACFATLQGQFKEKKVLNISSLYFLPSFRGPYVAYFCKNILDYAISEDYIITNYTPNSSVSFIFKKLGFRAMDGFRNYSTPLAFFSFNLIEYKILTGSLKLIHEIIPYDDDVCQILNFNPSFWGDVKVFKYIDRSINKCFFLALKKDYKKIGKFLGFPILRIYWVSDEQYVSEHWGLICLNIFLKWRVFYIIADFFNSRAFPSSLFYKTKSFAYLINDYSKTCKYIPPIGSELTFTIE